MNDTTSVDFDLSDMTVRLAAEHDLPAVRELFEHGVLEGHLRDNDTGADVDNLMEGYFSDDGASAFWVACLDKLVIGMIGVQKISANTAEMRRLRVRRGFRRRGVGSTLIEHASAFCRDKGYLRIDLDVRIERSPAIALFERHGFTLAHTREIGGRKLLVFYLDLYRRER